MTEHRFRHTLGRSWRLFRAFGHEQSDPDRFYGPLAQDSVHQVEAFGPIEGAMLLDVGGGPGYFADAFRAAGARYVGLDADHAELTGRGHPGASMVIGSGMDLPFADGAFDVSYSSNVLEHVVEPWTMADEMVRVTRPGGLVVIAYTLWWGPWGGHETAPWHLLGGRYARRRYVRKHGHEPKNKFGESLFAVTAGSGVRWLRTHPDLVDVRAFPRYLPRWMHWLVRVPGLRELGLWNVVLVGRRR
ncbi:class I SAM-dependent methyltransferase [Aeromicrobium sp. Root495]|uniref:class I SAM-dependent methyltransferase n=1 Tax=Aeromicrobium sp. Root495 TaxID=1736550 RepID=UPI001F37BCB4|nr:class I SAM-dependent methyltransferase [Aeromicrobium sp. Root495]